MGATSLGVDGGYIFMGIFRGCIKEGGGLRIFRKIEGIVLTLRDFSLKSGTIHNGTFYIFICSIMWKMSSLF